MQLKINEVVIPEKITFNYEELKQELVERVHLYETTVYTDDQIKAAKADRAQLNKLKKALNDERIRREREYMKPFEEFKSQINEIIGIIDKPVALIDKQVKDYEERKREEKRHEIFDIWDSLIGAPEWLELEQIYNPKWLNASYKLSEIEKEMNEAIRKVAWQTGIIKSLDEFSFEAMEVYKQTLDIEKAINEGKRLAEIQRRKREEQARREAEEQALALGVYMNKPEPLSAEAEAVEAVQEEITEPKQEVKFAAVLTVQQALKLRDFCKRNGIEIRPL